MDIHTFRFPQVGFSHFWVIFRPPVVWSCCTLAQCCAGLMLLTACSCAAYDLHTLRCHYRMQYKTYLFVLCAYKLKLQHVLQLPPVYEKTAKIYCANLLLYITYVESCIKRLSLKQQILFSTRLTMYLCVSIIIQLVWTAHSLFIRIFVGL